MDQITTSAELKEAIRLLEEKQKMAGEEVREEALLLYESLKPVNLFRSTVREVVTSPNLVDDLISMAIGLGSGYVSKKMISGTSNNNLKKILGTLMQLGVTALTRENLSNLLMYARAVAETIAEKRASETTSPE